MFLTTQVTAMVVAIAALTASPFSVALSAGTHAPKVGTRWTYVVKASQSGRPATGRLTVQIVDPVGGVHPAEFGASTKRISNVPFVGTFVDSMIFPAESRGVPLKVRATLHLAGTTRIVSYAVTPGG